MPQTLSSQDVTSTETVPNIEQVFNYLRDEGLPRTVKEVSVGSGLDMQTCASAVHLLGKRGLAEIIKEPGQFLKAHVAPNDIFVRKPVGGSRTKRKAKPVQKAKPMSQVVTAPEKKDGVTIHVNGRAFDVTEARTIYHALHIIFGRD